jgi:hypothetical protein
VFVAALIAALVAAGGVLVWRKQRVSSLRVAIDPFGVGEPWRRSVSAAQSAERRYLHIIGDTAPGPLRDRLHSIGDNVRRGVEQCFDIARAGDQLDDTLRRLDPAGLQRSLDRASDASAASLQRQLDSVQRIREQRDATDRQLRDLTTRLGELVTQAAEIRSLGIETDTVGSGVDEVVTQLEGLRLAVREVQTGKGGEPGASPGQVSATP